MRTTTGSKQPLCAAVLAGTIAVAGLATAAHAQAVEPRPLANLIGNTLRMTTRGSAINYQFHTDHTVSAIMPGGVRMQGSWRVAGQTMCTTLGMHGFTGPEVCVPRVPADKHPGDSWDTTYRGVTTHGEIIRGQAA